MDAASAIEGKPAPSGADWPLFRAPSDGRQLALAAVLLAVACALPFLVSNYRTFQFTLVLIYAIALLGLNILTGYNGQISLGHGAFYAIGAYVAAILMDKFGVPYWALHAAGRRRVPGRRLPVRPAGTAAGRPLPRAGHLRARRVPAAAAEVQAPRGMDRRRAGHRHHQARPAFRVCLRAALNPDQWLYFFTLAVTAGDVRARLEPAARARRPRADRHPRPADRGRDHGHQQRAVQVAHLRRERDVHRRRRRARRASRCSSSRPTVSPSSCRSPCWSAS